MKVKAFIINFGLFSLSLLIGIYSVEYFLLVTERSLSTVESSYAIAKKIDGALPLYAPWELMNMQNALIDIDGKKLFPVGSISNQKTVYCNENNGWLIYQSDMFGFNNDNKFVKDIVNGKKQLDTLFVGDSFVNGACVPRENNFQDVFLRTGRNALGFGIGGNGPMMYLATINEYASIVKPKNIFFMYYEGNDIPQIRVEMSSPLALYLNEDHTVGLIQHQAVIDSWMQQEIKKNYKRLSSIPSKNSPFVGFLKLEKLRTRIKNLNTSTIDKCGWSMDNYHQYAGEIKEQLIKTIVASQKKAEKINANFFFVYLKSANSLMNPCNYAHDEILSALKDKRIKFIDTTDLFYSHGEPRYELFSLGKRGGHYSVLGYRTVATYLMTEMSRE